MKAVIAVILATLIIIGNWSIEWKAVKPAYPIDRSAGYTIKR